MRNILPGLMAAFLLAVTAGMAFADDWTVTRLRGTVQHMVGGQWQPLERGSVVPDERRIFTRSNGHVTLVRGNESVELGPNTQIEIHDQGGRKPFTTVLQYAGVLTVEAERRNVQHFAVRTAYLAAVVKGTRFTVTARSSGGSVEVLRGQVSVEDKQSKETVLIVAGQKAKVDKRGGLSVSGKTKAAAKPPAGKGKTNASAGSGHATSGPDKTAGSGKTSRTDTSSTAAATTVLDTTTSTVATVVDTTTNGVDTVTDTADTVASTVDQVTNTSIVGDTVGTVTDTLGKTTKGLTGLLGKT